MKPAPAGKGFRAGAAVGDAMSRQFGHREERRNRRDHAAVAVTVAGVDVCVLCL